MDKKYNLKFNRNIIFNNVKYSKDLNYEVDSAFVEDWFISSLIKEGAIFVTKEISDVSTPNKSEQEKPVEVEDVKVEEKHVAKSNKKKNEPKGFKDKPNDGKEYYKGKYGRWYLKEEK